MSVRENLIAARAIVAAAKEAPLGTVLLVNDAVDQVVPHEDWEGFRSAISALREAAGVGTTGSIVSWLRGKTIKEVTSLFDRAIAAQPEGEAP